VKIKLYLKSPLKKESLIIAKIMWFNYQLSYSTKQSVVTEYWIKESKAGDRIQRVKQTNAYPVNTEINLALDNLRAAIQKVFIRYTNDNPTSYPTVAQLKEELDLYLKRGKQRVIEKTLPNFMEYFKEFIERSKRGIRINRKTSQALSKDTIKTYNTLWGHLEQYDNNLKWEDINPSFHTDYTDWLIETYDLSNSSVGKDFSIIKVVCSEAYYEKINKFDDYTDPRFSVSRETSSSIYLTNEDLNILWNLDLSHTKNLEETRDLFLLGCYTGLRFSDYSKIKKEQIDGNKLHVKTVKGGKQLLVSLKSSNAQAIVDKYNNELPKGTVNQVFNRHLKEICKDIPQFKMLIEKSYTKGGKRVVEEIAKFEMIKSHSARRSFCSNEVNAGTPVPIIMANSGHTTEKSFWKYVKLSNTHYHDMFSDILEERNKLKAF
jgi:integrase